MNLPINLANFTSIEKKNIYLISFLPISILMGSTVLNITILLIVCFFFLDCHKEKNFYFLKSKNFYFLISFNIYLILNSLITGISSESLVRSIGFVRFIILAYAIYYYINVDNKKYEKIIYKFWTIFFLIVTLDLFYEYIFGHNIFKFESPYLGRLASFTGDELKIGGYYFAFILISAIFLKNFNNKSFYLILIILLVVSLLIGERANFIKIVFMTLFFLLFINDIKFYKKLIYLLLFIALSFFIINNNNIIKNRFVDSTVSLFTTNFSPEKNMHICHFNTALTIFKNNPIIGVGVKKFRTESWKDKYAIQRDDGTYFSCGSTHPHQVHLELLSELGIIGYIFFIGYFVFFIFKGFKKFKNTGDKYAFASTLFIFASILPLIPSGSLFTTYTATLFWLNYAIALKNIEKLN